MLVASYWLLVASYWLLVDRFFVVGLFREGRSFFCGGLSASLEVLAWLHLLGSTPWFVIATWSLKGDGTSL